MPVFYVQCNARFECTSINIFINHTAPQTKSGLPATKTLHFFLTASLSLAAETANNKNMFRRTTMQFPDKRCLNLP